jgi:squalene-hopene/tetraprenyl-beta-curcumene cyclase
MQLRMLSLMVLAAAAGWGADWNPKLAAEYLDGRQKEWLAWPTANASGTPCFSCHTGAPYLFARPALRKALGEAEPTSFETALRDALKARLVKKTTKEWNPNGKEPGVSQGLGVESVWAAMFLGSEETFERMWSLQIREGKSKGSWAWFSLNDDPWEMPDSVYYGASMAALATSMAPKEYRERPEVRERTAALAGYLRDELPSQSLHNRLAALLASAKSNDFLPESARKAIVEEAWQKQSPDGGWSLAALGPWTPHEGAPAAEGSNSYATAVAALALQRAGATRSDARLAKALEWLKARQNRETGAWAADSMNKKYKPDSMMVRFMQDAATGYASLALLESR